METSFYNNLCGICLKTSEKLLKTTTTNSENVKWCDLLATCVPEVVSDLHNIKTQIMIVYL